MRQVLLEKGSIKVKEVFEPLLQDDSVLVSVHYSCISSGTENSTITANKNNGPLHNLSQKITKVLESVSINGIEGTRALIKSKLLGEYQALGYSCSGKVIAVGKKVTTLRPGDFVACGGAEQALHADTVVVPVNLVVKISGEQHVKAASITTIGAIALQGVRRAQVQLGETVAVIGLGLLGQLTVQILKQSGCRVIGIDLQEERLKQAIAFGADETYQANDPQLHKQINFTTNLHGCDATIITAGSSSNAIIQQAMEITRKKGKVVIVGDVGMQINRSPFYQKEIDVLISCSYGPGRYDATYERDGIDYPFAYVRWTENRNMQAFLHLVETGKIDTATLMKEEFSIDHAADAYKKLAENNLLCATLSYLPKQFVGATHIHEKSLYASNTTYIPPLDKKVRVALIGAGGFAKVKLLPILSKMSNVSIVGVVDANMTNALNVGKLYSDAQTTTHELHLANQDNIDAFVISSPHKYHYEQALHALSKGKAVFLEKPMITTFQQLEQLQSFITTHPSIPFCVDYNRSFSPFAQKIKKELNKRKNPIVMQYRMNAGFIPKDHWIQTEIGAGRIIGEACHIFDLFAYLTDAQPRSISVEAIAPTHENLFPTDNFSAQISYSDGSVCSLLYTALGHSGLGKERLELFYDSKTIVMDDYKTLQGYGTSLFFNEKTSHPDKGHDAILQSFINSLHTTSPEQVIAHKRLYETAQITLIADKLACQGGGNFEIKQEEPYHKKHHSSQQETQP